MPMGTRPMQHQFAVTSVRCTPIGMQRICPYNNNKSGLAARYMALYSYYYMCVLKLILRHSAKLIYNYSALAYMYALILLHMCRHTLTNASYVTRLN